MRSLSIDSTSSASAYLRRITSMLTSGVVSTSSVEITLSKKSMFVFAVMMMSLLERSSATISTLPRIMPRSASETAAVRTAFGVDGVGSGLLRPGRLLRLRRRFGCGAAGRAKPGPPLDLTVAAPFWSSFCDSVTIVSR